MFQHSAATTLTRSRIIEKDVRRYLRLVFLTRFTIECWLMSCEFSLLSTISGTRHIGVTGRAHEAPVDLNLSFRQVPPHLRQGCPIQQPA